MSLINARKRVVVLGAGWGGYNFARTINRTKFDVTLISPRNHFVFTPLLPSAAVGTLEYRCIQEPVRTIPNLRYYQAKAREIDLEKKELTMVDEFQQDKHVVPYDYLVLSNGSQTNTFNTPGVKYGKNNVYFLKSLEHAREIRHRILECFERASFPEISNEERDRLLNFVIVGGGPISVEFSGELYSFLKTDVAKWYPELKPHIKVHLIEGSKHVLGPFNKELVDYAETLLKKRKFDLRTGVVAKEVRDGEIELSDGSIIPCGLVVWSTGVKPTKFISKLEQNFKSDFQFWHGRLLVDETMRVLRPGKNPREGFLEPHRDIFAIGDCAVSSTKPLPTLGVVAKWQGGYLAKNFNNEVMEEAKKPFKYIPLVQMTALGAGEGLIDPTISAAGERAPVFKGFQGKVLWMAGYWGAQVSWVNKFLIPMFWFKSWLFGRDISRF